jgi:hypothetical protein
LQNCRIAELQDCRIAEWQKGKMRIADWQDVGLQRRFANAAIWQLAIPQCANPAILQSCNPAILQCCNPAN